MDVWWDANAPFKRAESVGCYFSASVAEPLRFCLTQMTKRFLCPNSPEGTSNTPRHTSQHHHQPRMHTPLSFQTHPSSAMTSSVTARTSAADASATASNSDHTRQPTQAKPQPACLDDMWRLHALVWQQQPSKTVRSDSLSTNHATLLGHVKHWCVSHRRLCSGAQATDCCVLLSRSWCCRC